MPLQVRILDHETLIMSVYSNRHADYFNRPLDTLLKTTCDTCKRLRPLSRMQMEGGDDGNEITYERDNGVCTCVHPQVKERIRITAYSPATKGGYVKVLSNDEMCVRLRKSIRQGDLPHDGLIATALELKPLPTDWLLGYNQVPYAHTKRDRFEPLLEAHRARIRANTWRTLAKCRRWEAQEAQKRHRRHRAKQRNAAITVERHRMHFENTQKYLLRAILYRTAMVQAADNAMDFSKEQLKRYEDAELRDSAQACP